MEKITPELPNVAAPRAPYSPAVIAGDFIFISGQVGRDPDSVLPESTVDQTRVAMENIGRILSDLGLGFESLVKTTVFLTDINDFGVVNDVYATFFEETYPARSTYAVAALPRPELKVEIEAVAVR